MAKEEIAPAGAISSFVTMFSNVVCSSRHKNKYLWSKGLIQNWLFIFRLTMRFLRTSTIRGYRSLPHKWCWPRRGTLTPKHRSLSRTRCGGEQNLSYLKPDLYVYMIRNSPYNNFIWRTKGLVTNYDMCCFGNILLVEQSNCNLFFFKHANRWFMDLC